MDAIVDRLGELLGENDLLYGVICRDVTLIDIELMAQEGYHIVWIDLEHNWQSSADAIQLSRTIAHLGMVPLVRIRELSRTNVQPLLDGGVQVIVLPDVRSAKQAAELVQLGKYPPNRTTQVLFHQRRHRVPACRRAGRSASPGRRGDTPDGSLRERRGL